MSVFSSSGETSPTPLDHRDVCCLFSWMPYLNRWTHLEAQQYADRAQGVKPKIAQLSLLDANVISQRLHSLSSRVDDWSIQINWKKRKINEYRRSLLGPNEMICEDYYFVRMTDLDQTVVFPKLKADSRVLELDRSASGSSAWEEAFSQSEELVGRSSWAVHGNRFYIGGAVVSVGVLEQANAPVRCVIEVVTRHQSQSSASMPVASNVSAGADDRVQVASVLAALLPAELLNSHLEEVRLRPGDLEGLICCGKKDHSCDPVVRSRALLWLYCTGLVVR